MKERAQPTTVTTESVRWKREVAHIPGLSPAEMALLAFLPEDERELFMAAMVSTTPAPVTTTSTTTSTTTQMPALQEELVDIPGLSPEEMAFLAFLPEEDRQMFMAAMVQTTPPPVTTTTTVSSVLQEDDAAVSELSSA